MIHNDLKGSTVVITGASSGIGKAAAYAFAKEGCNLVLGARSETLLQELASECETIGGRAVPVPVDVSDRNSVKVFFETALDFYGSIDIWINNAGVGAVGEFDETPLDAHEQVIKTNLLGPLYAAYEVISYFKKHGHGTLITTNSTGAYIGSPLSVAYSASKFGLRGLSEALRFELKDYKDIHVCDVFASFVNSPGMKHAANYVGKELKPAPPLVEPEEVAAAMVKLALRPKSSVHLGSTDYLGRFGHALLPEVAGRMLNRFERAYFKKARKASPGDGNLYGPNYDESEIHGNY